MVHTLSFRPLNYLRSFEAKFAVSNKLAVFGKTKILGI